MRAAIYCRVSTADQVDGTSLESQREMCLRVVRERGWDAAAEFVEDFSGTSSDRPQWRRMLAAATAGQFEAVVVAKLDRFGRNAGHAITEIDRLVELGVTFISVKEQLDLSTAGGRMMRTMLAGFAEMERDIIVERTTSGQRAKAAQGRWPGGEPPYGWMLTGKGRDCQVVPCPSEREVIALAHQWLVQDRLSTWEVADRLNDAGLGPRKSARWTYDKLRRVILNPSLADGQYLWGQVRNRRGGTGTGKSAHRTRVRPDGTALYGGEVAVQLPDPPLTSSQYREIERVLRTRPSRPDGSVKVYPLSDGRLVSMCGQHFSGTFRNDRQQRRYLCTGKRWRGKDRERCGCLPLDADRTEAAVWDQVVGLLGDPDRLQAMARQWLNLGEAAGPLTAMPRS